jgi:hypothetical protein
MLAVVSSFSRHMRHTAMVYSSRAVVMEMTEMRIIDVTVANLQLGIRAILNQWAKQGRTEVYSV